MTKLEKDIEEKLRRVVERHGGVCLKWVCPGWSGVPDRIVIMPGGLVHFVELKRPKDSKTGKLQLWWQKRLKALGCRARFILSDIDVDLFEEELKRGFH